MADEEEKPKPFKVDDRRRFSAEGELKPEHREDEERPETGASPETAARPQTSAAEPQAAPGYAAAHAAGGLGSTPEITFGTFVVGLSTQALMHLGEIPDPQGGAMAPDLPAAQQLIDIIGMLQEKTRGNLDHDEQALLDAVLFDLRMKYVERARPAAR
jgi:uncharacterized protein DUF1844